MFNILRHTIADTGILRGGTDWHCHILPGVDDGMRDMTDSLMALDELYMLGVEEIWLTPHIMEDVPNTTEKLKERFAELQEKYSGNIRLHLAAEYMMDSLFESRLEAGDLLPIGESGKHLLVETSYFNPPARFSEIVKSILSAGYFPVLAHPERYMYMDMEDYGALRSAGVRFQLNLPSLAGHYGRQVREKALTLLNDGMYDIAGTDMHRTGMNRMFTTDRCLSSKPYHALKKNKLLNNL